VLDKYKCYKKMINAIALSLSACVVCTFIVLALDLPHGWGIALAFISGFPMFAVPAPIVQFIAEVVYPTSEIQGISLMNVINKLISFGMVKLGNNLSFFLVFFIWAVLPLLGLIPGRLVEEDLRRLNIAEVSRTDTI
jgi:hypothetical protein